eukprot:scaffold633_cov288-Ochromonas_danica.AAC.47
MSTFLQVEEEEGYSGLVRDIRTSLTSEQFDLGGYNEVRTRDLVLQAFTKPLPVPTEMVKFTFIIGGGKLVRSRYPDELGKWMTSALREVGYQEDHSAAETFDSQGSYKHQHDTGQNLKYLIVFPRLVCGQNHGQPSTTTTTTAGAGGGGGGGKEEVLRDTSSPHYLLLTSPLPTFQAMIADKVTSYSQKKAAMQMIEDYLSLYHVIEQKLVHGELITASEQLLFDSLSGCEEEKITFLQGSVKEMVDQGQLTAREKANLLDHLQHNLLTLDHEEEEAKREGKEKKKEKVLQKKANCQARREHVQKISAITPRLKYSDEIIRHYVRLFPLLALEEKARSMSLSLQDLKQLEEKSDLEEAIANLQAASRGWFVEEEDFQTLCHHEEQLARSQYKALQQQQQKKKTSSGPGKSVGGGGGGGVKSTATWSTVTKKASSSSSLGKSSSGGGKKASSSYAAAFGDEDSDD